MTDVRHKPSGAFLGKEFNNFLYASIGMDRIGVQLSVVSALARLNMDPWDEAKKLLQMPRDSAVQTLTAWMLRFPELVSGYDDRNSTAKRLVALLPWPAGTAARNADDVASGTVSKSAIAVFCLLALALLVAGQIVWALQPATHVSSKQAASPVSVSAKAHGAPGS